MATHNKATPYRCVMCHPAMVQPYLNCVLKYVLNTQSRRYMSSKEWCEATQKEKGKSVRSPTLTTNHV